MAAANDPAFIAPIAFPSLAMPIATITAKGATNKDGIANILTASSIKSTLFRIPT